jgi:hypothetical protein
VVGGFRHMSVIQPGASCAQQEQRLGASLQHNKSAISRCCFLREGNLSLLY